MNVWTGPWEITQKLKGSSYEIRHVNSNQIGKRHAAHLSPFPNELLPFLPVDGPNNAWGQIHTPIQKDPYKRAGIKGFEPPQPFKTVACPALPDQEEIHFPTLAELNAELFEWDPEEEEAMLQDESIYNDTEIIN